MFRFGKKRNGLFACWLSRRFRRGQLLVAILVDQNQPVRPSLVSRTLENGIASMRFAMLTVLVASISLRAAERRGSGEARFDSQYPKNRIGGLNAKVLGHQFRTVTRRYRPNSLRPLPSNEHSWDCPVAGSIILLRKLSARSWTTGGHGWLRGANRRLRRAVSR